MSDPAQDIVLALDGAVATVTINRPAASNAISSGHVRALAAVLRACMDDGAVRAVVLTGAGGKYFCCGADVAELAVGIADIRVHLASWHTLLDGIEASPKPVIAAINGTAVGGGLELALACHWRVAADNALFGLPELKVGLFPAAGGVSRLARLAGASRAIGFVLEGGAIGVQAADKLGIVDRTVPAADLLAEAARMGARIAGYAPNAVTATLRCAQAPATQAGRNQLESDWLAECYGQAANRSLLQAFLSRKKPAPVAAR